MGYTTDFSGRLSLTGELSQKRLDYVNTLCKTRRMKRDVNKLMELYKGKYGHPDAKEEMSPEEIYGIEGEYFAKENDNDDFLGDKDASVIDYNEVPGHIPYGLENFMEGWDLNQERIQKGLCQPGLWCGWEFVEEDGLLFLQWDGGEKFYNYVEWLIYLISRFFEPWGIKLKGKIQWQGEDPADRGIIIVADNVVVTKIGRTIYK